VTENPDLRLVEKAEEANEGPAALTPDEIMGDNKRSIWAVRATAQVQISDPEAANDRSIDMGIRFFNHFIDEAQRAKVEAGEIPAESVTMLSRFGNELAPAIMARAVILAFRMAADEMEKDFNDPESVMLLQLQSMIDGEAHEDDRGTAEVPDEEKADEAGETEVVAEAAPAEAKPEEDPPLVH
jgi:hypothetical protein